MYNLVNLKIMRNGKYKSEKYLTLSQSVTESEAIIAKEFGEVGAMFQVDGSRNYELSGFLKKDGRDNDEPFKTYLVTVKIDMNDDEEKPPKYQKEKYLVEADNNIEASNRMTEHYNDTMLDFVIDKVEYSNFMDVLPRGE